MNLAVVTGTKWERSGVTRERRRGHSSEANVAFHVQSQVIGAGEGAFTKPALKRSITGVFAVVTGQFIGTGELPSATLPGALVGFFTRVRPQVSLQVRRFRVRLGAAGLRARVDDNTALAPSPTASGPLGRGDRGPGHRWCPCHATGGVAAH